MKRMHKDNNSLLKLQRMKTKNLYYTVKDVFSEMVSYLREAGKNIGYTDEQIMDDIRDEVREVMGDYID